jgi:transposase
LKVIKYKAKLQGIQVIEVPEPYTSRCSALDLEPVKKHNKYLGQRGMLINPTPNDKENSIDKSYVTFRLFKSKDYGIIHADVDGALNIGR